MTPTLTLRNAVRDIWSLDVDGTIYAALPWTEESVAIVAQESASGGPPAEAQDLGLKYFLEVFVAREFLGGWRETLGAKPSVAQECARLIQYALNDA